MDLSKYSADGPIARNQYRGVLEGMSKQALLQIAKDEHGLNPVADIPKSKLIEQILSAKYGKEVT